MRSSLTLPSSIRRAAAELLYELESSRLEVILVPSKRFANEGGMIRVAASKNARWYRQFCATYTSARRRRNLAVDTAIKRANTLRVLRAIADGEFRETPYFSRLVSIARQRATERNRAQPSATEIRQLNYSSLCQP